jgi:ABC-2 type transport system permease protein
VTVGVRGPAPLRWPAVVAASAARRVLNEPGGLVVAMGFDLVVVAALTGMWRVAAEANGGAIAGYSAVALTWYIATSEAAMVCLNIRMIDDIGRDIGSGTVAVELLRPAPVLGVRVAAEVGWVLPRLVACAATGAAVALVTAGGPPDVTGLALAVPAMVLGVTCNIVTQHAFAAAAFWVRDAGSAWFLYQKLVFLLGGMLIPLEVLPGWMQGAAAALPFRVMCYVPARLASGHVEPLLLAQQVAWLAAMAAVAALVFRAGERRLQVVGG